MASLSNRDNDASLSASSKTTYQSLPLELRQKILRELLRNILTIAVRIKDRNVQANIVAVKMRIDHLLKVSPSFEKDLMSMLSWFRDEIDQKTCEAKEELRRSERTQQEAKAEQQSLFENYLSCTDAEKRINLARRDVLNGVEAEEVKVVEHQEKIVKVLTAITRMTAKAIVD